MNSLLLDVGGPDYLAVLAHEFYHMIQFANDANEDSWVNEGMADVAIEVNGFGDLTSSHTSDYSTTPGDQLTHWESQLYDYGNAYSFFSYFLSHYGPADDPATPVKENYALAEDITKVEADGLAGVDAVLAGNPYKASLDPYYHSRTANDVYLDRAVANVINDSSVGAGQYGYDAPLSSFKVAPTDSTSGPGTGSGTGRTYGDQIVAVDSAADGRFTVDGEPEIPIVLNTPTSGGHELWSNRVDETTTWAERTAVLPAGGSPHLRFNYWYDLEEDYDYAYLRVSDDGGATWTNLACCGSRTTNPNGNNRGNGITGVSGATTLDPTAKWQAADVDLSAYAGKTVTIRFEYVTDPAVNNPGLTLDDVELVDGSTAIWPKATFESGLDGFERRRQRRADLPPHHAQLAEPARPPAREAGQRHHGLALDGRRHRLDRPGGGRRGRIPHVRDLQLADADHVGDLRLHVVVDRRGPRAAHACDAVGAGRQQGAAELDAGGQRRHAAAGEVPRPGVAGPRRAPNRRRRGRPRQVELELQPRQRAVAAVLAQEAERVVELLRHGAGAVPRRLVAPHLPRPDLAAGRCAVGVDVLRLGAQRAGGQDDRRGVRGRRRHLGGSLER